MNLMYFSLHNMSEWDDSRARYQTDFLPLNVSVAACLFGSGGETPETENTKISNTEINSEAV